MTHPVTAADMDAIHTLSDEGLGILERLAKVGAYHEQELDGYSPFKALRFSFVGESSIYCFDGPAIIRENQHGGDPHVLGILKRIYKPEQLQELAILANAVPSLVAEIKRLRGAA